MTINSVYRALFFSGLTLSAIYLSSCVSKPTLPTGVMTSSSEPVQPQAMTQTTVSAVTSVVVSRPAQPNMAQSVPQFQQQPQPVQPQFQQQLQQNYASFSDWKSDFINRTSHAHGFNQINQLLGDANLNNRVIHLDGNQAEFAKMPWEYINSAVSGSRINQGRQKKREQMDILAQNENYYGVPASIVTAIWGMESSFGAGMGEMDLVDALSSLAYDGRRREFAEKQLLSMLSMVERGDVQANQLKGSWAGGMGHTQFIPSTWLTYGVDGNRDGRKNPWAVADALSSTANYLAQSGWVRGLPAYIEVRLPAITPMQFNQNFQGKKSLDMWRSLGLTALHDNLSGAHLAELWLPAGINGPALLLTANFDVIKVYNNSASYALAVSSLANAINGRATISTQWPHDERGLSRGQIERLQSILTAKGYDTKGIDGVAGSNTRLAFARWQVDNGQFADGFISQRNVSALLH